MKCPYCGGQFKKKIDYFPLSARRRKILDLILEAGPNGLPVEVLESDFFSGRSKTSIRTTIHSMNKSLSPNKIRVHGRVVRIIPDREKDC